MINYSGQYQEKMQSNKVRLWEGGSTAVFITMVVRNFASGHSVYRPVRPTPVLRSPVADSALLLFAFFLFFWLCSVAAMQIFLFWIIFFRINILDVDVNGCRVISSREVFFPYITPHPELGKYGRKDHPVNYLNILKPFLSRLLPDHTENLGTHTTRRTSKTKDDYLECHLQTQPNWQHGITDKQTFE